MVFHEITRDAIRAAAENTRDLDHAPGRRAGDPAHPRPAVRLRGLARCCGRRSCRACPPAGCSRSRPAWSWSASASGSRSAARRTGTSRALLRPGPRSTPRLVAVDGARVATGTRLRRPTAQLTAQGRRGRTSTRPRPARWPRRCADARVRRPLRRRQAVPALAGRAVHDLDAAAGGQPQAAACPPRRTMRVAQRLYENGYITYMRTDSTTLSESALDRGPHARPRELYGAEYVADAPRRYDPQGQERAGGARGDPPVRRRLPHARRRSRPSCHGDEFALYDLIWKRTVASQMTDARGTTVTDAARAPRRPTAATRSSPSAARSSRFRGFLAAYEEGRDDDAGRGDGDDGRPSAGCRQLDGRRRADAAAARGRRATRPSRRRATPRRRWSRRSRSAASAGPSTYASIIGTILDRGYVCKRGTALVPSFLAFSVVRLLEEHFRGSSTTTSPRGWRTCSTTSPAGSADRVDACSASSTAATRPTDVRRACTRWSTTSATSTRASCHASRSADSGIVLRVGRYGPYLERDAGDDGEPRPSAPTCPRTCRPTS